LLLLKGFSNCIVVFIYTTIKKTISLKEYLRAEDDKRLNIDFRFSPVLVIILHHGERPFTGPTEVAELYEDYGILADYLPRRRAILFDLSTLSESEVPDDPEVPELFVVLRIMQVIFSTDIGTKVQEVLERLKPYSEIPKYRRLIRFLWWYFVSNARKESRRGVMTVTEAVKRIIGEKDMSMVLEMLKAEGKAEGAAEGEARGEARGAVLTLLRTKFKTVPKATEDAIRSMTDLTALESLAIHAETCQSLEEFEKAIG